MWLISVLCKTKVKWEYHHRRYGQKHFYEWMVMSTFQMLPGCSYNTGHNAIWQNLQSNIAISPLKQICIQMLKAQHWRYHSHLPWGWWQAVRHNYIIHFLNFIIVLVNQGAWQESDLWYHSTCTQSKLRVYSHWWVPWHPHWTSAIKMPNIFHSNFPHDVPSSKKGFTLK